MSHVRARRLHYVRAAANEPMHVGRFHIITALGRGGSSEVFLAIPDDARPMPVVVVKRIRSDVAGDPQWADMMRDEAHVTSRLSHPNIVQLLEVGSDVSVAEHGGSEQASEQPQSYLVMEHVDGQTLSRFERLRASVAARTNDDGLSIGAKLLMIVDVLAALHYVHELTDAATSRPLHTVHRDVTPHNVLITYDGHVKLFDFGIAKATDTCVETKPSTLKGKLRYMSPEQARAERVDRRTDIFAAGVMLHELLTGRRFWDKSLNAVEIHTRLASGDYQTSLGNPFLPNANRLEAICERALAYDPKHRYQTAREMRLDLMSVLMKHNAVEARCELGRTVSKLFADERAKIASLVKQQLERPARRKRAPLICARELPAAPHPRALRPPPLSSPHTRIDTSLETAIDSAVEAALGSIPRALAAPLADVAVAMPVPDAPRAPLLLRKAVRKAAPPSPTPTAPVLRDEVAEGRTSEPPPSSRAVPTAPTTTPTSAPDPEKKKRTTPSALSRVVMLTTFLIAAAGSAMLTYTHAPASLVERSAHAEQVVVAEAKRLTR